MITTSYIREHFSIEEAVSDERIEQQIQFVEESFRRGYGADIFTGSYADVAELAATNLIASRLLSERVCLTGFGLVVKQDDYSDPATEEQYTSRANSLIDTASVILYHLPFHSSVTRSVIQDCSLTQEGFFPAKKTHGYGTI